MTHRHWPKDVPSREQDPMVLPRRASWEPSCQLPWRFFFPSYCVKHHAPARKVYQSWGRGFTKKATQKKNTKSEIPELVMIHINLKPVQNFAEVWMTHHPLEELARSILNLPSAPWCPMVRLRSEVPRCTSSTQASWPIFRATARRCPSWSPPGDGSVSLSCGALVKPALHWSSARSGEPEELSLFLSWSELENHWKSTYINIHQHKSRYDSEILIHQININQPTCSCLALCFCCRPLWV